MAAIVCFIIYHKKRKSAALEAEKRQPVDELLIDWDVIEKQYNDGDAFLPTQGKLQLATPDGVTRSSPHSHEQTDSTMTTANNSNSALFRKSKEYRSSYINSSDNIIVLQKPDIGGGGQKD